MVFSQISVPDYENGIKFLYIAYNQRWTQWARIQLYEAPSDGYICISDCYTSIDYFLYINKVVANRQVYHKCGGSRSSNGMFSIRKGDKLILEFVGTGNGGGSDGSTFIFYPAKKQ